MFQVVSVEPLQLAQNHEEAPACLPNHGDCNDLRRHRCTGFIFFASRDFFLPFHVQEKESMNGFRAGWDKELDDFVIRLGSVVPLHECISGP